MLRKMGDLETSLDVPALVAKLTGPNPARDAVTARAKELMEKELLALGDDITRNPEIGFVEKLADPRAVLEEACRLAHRLATRPSSAYAASKRFLRHGLASTMEARDEKELELFLDHWYSSETQDRIGALVSEMRRR